MFLWLLVTALFGMHKRCVPGLSSGGGLGTRLELILPMKKVGVDGAHLLVDAWISVAPTKRMSIVLNCMSVVLNCMSVVLNCCLYGKSSIQLAHIYLLIITVPYDTQYLYSLCRALAVRTRLMNCVGRLRRQSTTTSRTPWTHWRKTEMLLWTELTIEYQLIGKLHRVQRLSRRICMLQQQQQKNWSSTLLCVSRYPV